MTHEQLLNRLNTYQKPHPPSDWLLAPGWYIVILITMLFSVWLIKKCYTWFKKKRQIRYLQAQCDQILLNYQDNAHQYANQITIYLKRILLSRTYASRKEVIKTLYGDKWAAFLNAFKQDIDLTSLAKAQYDPAYPINLQTTHHQIINLIPYLINPSYRRINQKIAQFSS